VELTGILHDIVRGTVDAQRDIRVVADVDDCASLDRLVDTTKADFIITGVDGDVRTFYPRLLNRRPEVKVLAVQNEDQEWILWETRPISAPLGELSPPLLLSVLRSVRDE
jgi:hypothetical protein